MRNLEDYGTNTQSGSGRYKDAKRLGISRHIIRAIGKIRGMPKAARAITNIRSYNNINIFKL